VINRHGYNDYDLPQMGKAALERQRILPERLEAIEEAIELVKTFLGDLDGEDMD
jgi:hypothetical protein